jgi:peptidoglycan/xylan/chitin deacetylase (PgdA/CDA1 family)
MEIKIDQVSYSDITVVMYHYVRDIKKSSYKNIKGLETKCFIEQIKYLKKNYNIIRIEELIESIEKKIKLPPKALLLTFDDGYADHFKNVFPVLKEFNIQGSFYIPAKAVIYNEVLDVNKLHFILASETNTTKIIDDIKKLLCEYKLKFNLEDFNYYYKKLAFKNRWDNPNVIFIKRLLQVELNEGLRLLIVNYLFKKYVGVKESDFAKKLYVNEDQIKTMLKSGMHIGCHGYNHYWWNRLSSSDLEKEIDLSLHFLKNLGVDISKWTSAYPYGSYNQDVKELLEYKKCRVAFTTDLGIANNSYNNRLTMKRLDTNDIPVDSNSPTNKWFKKSK